MATSSNCFEHLLPPSWKPQVTTWLAEDTPSFDYGGFVVGEVQREAFLLGKGQEPAVLAGSPFFTEVFTQLGCEYVVSRAERLLASINRSQGGMAHEGRRYI